MRWLHTKVIILFVSESAKLCYYMCYCLATIFDNATMLAWIEKFVFWHGTRTICFSCYQFILLFAFSLNVHTAHPVSSSSCWTWYVCVLFILCEKIKFWNKQHCVNKFVWICKISNKSLFIIIIMNCCKWNCAREEMKSYTKEQKAWQQQQLLQ